MMGLGGFAMLTASGYRPSSFLYEAAVAAMACRPMPRSTRARSSTDVVCGRPTCRDTKDPSHEVPQELHGGSVGHH